jgi:beta-1,4-mannosyltransferase
MVERVAEHDARRALHRQLRLVASIVKKVRRGVATQRQLKREREESGETRAAQLLAISAVGKIMINQLLTTSRPVSRVSVRVGSWPGPSSKHNSMIPILCGALQRRGAKVVDVLHPWRISPKEIDLLQIHWPEQVFWRGGSRLKKVARVGLTLVALARLRCAGVRVTWMVHNVRPHDSRTLSSVVWPFYILGLKMLIKHYITLSPMTQAVVRQRLRLSPKAVVAYIRHPSYPSGSSREVARPRLGISLDLRVYVFFGKVRPYKGVDELLDAFGALADPSARLIIAGEPSLPSVKRMLSAKAKLDPRITLRLGYIQEDTLSDIIDAADRIVLPFTNYLHSGSLIRALSQGKVTITPEAPFACALRDELGEQWVQLYQGRLTAEHLSINSEQQGAPDMSAYEPDRVAEELLRCYRSILETD